MAFDDAGSVSVSIRGDLSPLEQALARAERVSRAGADVMQRAVDGVQKSWDAAAQAAARAGAQFSRVQQQINSAAGVRDFGTAERAKDVAAYGAELDRLRAKFNPIFAASKQYENELEDLNAAQRVGAITAEEHGRALLTLNERYAAATRLSNAMGVSIGQSSYLTKQLSFQLFDIGQSASLAFQAPFYFMQNFAIQTGQIAQLYAGEGGLRKALEDTKGILAGLATGARTAGAALLASLLTPVGLITAGFVAAGAAVGAFVLYEINRLPSASQAAERHKKYVDAIKDAWGEAASASDEYARRGRTNIEFLTNQDVRTQQEALQRALQGALGTGGFAGTGTAGTGNALVTQLQQLLDQISLRQQGITLTFTETQRAMEAFAPALKNFLDSVERGEPDVRSLDTAVKEIANEHPERPFQLAADVILSKLAPALQIVKDLRDVTSQIPRLRIDQAFGVAAQGPTPADVAAQQLATERRQLQASLQGVGARTPGQLAGAARARAAAQPLSEDETPQLREFRIAAAGALAYAQAVEQINRQTEGLRASADASAALIKAYNTAPETVDAVQRHTEALAQAQAAGIDVSTKLGQAWLSAAEAASQNADALAKVSDYYQSTRSFGEQYADELRQIEELHKSGALQGDLYFRALAQTRMGYVQSVADSLSTLGGLLEGAFNNSKEAAIANALLSSGRAIVGAYAQGAELGGPVVGAIFAGLAAAATARQIAQIRSVNSKGGGSVSAGGSSGAGTATSAAASTPQPTPVFVSLHADRGRDFSEEQVRNLIKQIGALSKDGVQVQVVQAA